MYTVHCVYQSSLWLLYEINHYTNTLVVQSRCSLQVQQIGFLSRWDPNAVLSLEAVAYSCNTVGWFWWDWSLSQWQTGFLQCFDTVGWVIWPVKIVPEMTYKVSSGTLSLYSLNRCRFSAANSEHNPSGQNPPGWNSPSHNPPRSRCPLGQNPPGYNPLRSVSPTLTVGPGCAVSLTTVTFTGSRLTRPALTLKSLLVAGHPRRRRW